MMAWNQCPVQKFTIIMEITTFTEQKSISLTGVVMVQ